MIDTSTIKTLTKNYSITELDDLISALIAIKEDKIRIEIFNKFEKQHSVNENEYYIGAPN